MSDTNKDDLELEEELTRAFEHELGQFGAPENIAEYAVLFWEARSKVGPQPRWTEALRSMEERATEHVKLHDSDLDKCGGDEVQRWLESPAVLQELLDQLTASMPDDDADFDGMHLINSVAALTYLKICREAYEAGDAPRAAGALLQASSALQEADGETFTCITKRLKRPSENLSRARSIKEEQAAARHRSWLLHLSELIEKHPKWTRNQAAARLASEEGVDRSTILRAVRKLEANDAP